MDVQAACKQCGAQHPSALLACPACGALVHAEQLKRLAAEAEAAQQANDHAAALLRWRAALMLLPPASRQHAVIAERITALSSKIAVSPQPAPTPATTPAWVKRLGPFGAVALLLWNFKFVVIAVLSKAKLLLLGLTKMSTLFSMLLSMGAYWALYGWKFGVGLVLSIYVHEMGHVAALRRFGIPASAPMFIPGFGAVVRLGAHPATVVEDATVGLAGPLWGLGATLLAFGLWAFTGDGGAVFLAIAHTGAWLNLFNLLPVWQLDGSRGFAALSRKHRMLITAAFFCAWALTSENLLVLLGIVAAIRIPGKDAPAEGDRTILGRFLFLIAALAYLLSISVTGR